jgi:glycosyltransferase involved in cell wall biosynthesis
LAPKRSAIEQIADEREALVVPIERHAVAGAIRRLLDDGDLAAGIARRGRELVERRHDAEAHMDRLAETYRTLARPR